MSPGTGSCVICSMIIAFKDSRTQGNISPYSPTKLYEILKQGNEGLLNGKQQDAHECWTRLMQTIENKNKCLPMLSKLFVHEVITSVECDFCNIMSETEKEYNGHVIEFCGRDTIQEAVDAYFSEETLEIYKCAVCEHINKHSAKKKYSLKNVPKVLCLVLNRFKKDGNKIKDDIEISDLELTNLTDENVRINYKLVSTVNHIGESPCFGHYTATACGTSKLCYEFDDSYVRRINSIKSCNAYILIYELSNKVFLLLNRFGSRLKKNYFEVNETCVNIKSAAGMGYTQNNTRPEANSKSNINQSFHEYSNNRNSTKVCCVVSISYNFI